MNHMINIIRQKSAEAMGNRASVRCGIVTSYNPATYSAKVRIQPGDKETGWLPITSPWIGNGWGMFSPVTVGDSVEVQYQEDDFEAGFICGRFYNDTDRPLTVQSGECWLFHVSGSFIKLTNDGRLLLNGNVSIDATAPIVNITATGNINATAGGNINATAAGTATVTAASIILKNAGASIKRLVNELFVTLYNGHTHTSAAAGSQTNVPTQQGTIGTQTTNTTQAE